MIYDSLTLRCSESISGLFIPELQKGFYIISEEGQTLYKFLTEDCGIKNGYITEKIKTIFINGGPVDDIYNTKIREGGVCALSGAMPGIVGGMMRIGSPYAPMRESITVRPDDSGKSGKKILYELKLFNVILSDTGSEFLKKGILLDKKRIIDFFIKFMDEIREGKSIIAMNDLSGEMQLADFYEKNLRELVLLKIELFYETKS
jgi:hypothetical protein